MLKEAAYVEGGEGGPLSKIHAAAGSGARKLAVVTGLRRWSGLPSPGGQPFSKRWDVQPWHNSSRTIATPTARSLPQHVDHSFLNARGPFPPTCPRAERSGADFPLGSAVRTWARRARSE